MSRIAAPAMFQFWDKARLVSHRMGEHDDKSIVWDHIEIYHPGARWDQAAPPTALYKGGPVYKVTDAVRTALAGALEQTDRLTAR
jgi:hypothetical protein